jgi:hypothetical protein
MSKGRLRGEGWKSKNENNCLLLKAQNPKPKAQNKIKI